MKRYTGIFMALIVVLMFLTRSHGAEWAGREIVKEGVIYVYNSEKSVGGSERLQLKYNWSAGTEDDEEGPIFGLVQHLTIDENLNAYLLDYQLSEITVLSPTGKFIRKIGRRGQGPGDFLRPDGICISPNGEIWVAMAYPSRIARYAKDGSPIGTLVLPEDSEGEVPVLISISCAGNRVIAHASQGQESYICALDDMGVRTTIYYKERHLNKGPTPIYEEKSRALRGRWATSKDHVFVASDFNDYQINVYNLDGTLDRVIHREYEHRKRSGQEKQAIYEWANINPAAVLPDTKFQIEDYDKDIMMLYVRDDGTCWVLTSRGFYDRPSGTSGVFDVFDKNGRFLKQVTLVGEGNPLHDRYFFRGEFLYIVKCYTGAVARLVDSNESSGWFDTGCEDPMSIISYRLE